jgi:hypothetical protein
MLKIRLLKIDPFCKILVFIFGVSIFEIEADIACVAGSYTQNRQLKYQEF